MAYSQVEVIMDYLKLCRLLNLEPVKIRFGRMNKPAYLKIQKGVISYIRFDLRQYDREVLFHEVSHQMCAADHYYGHGKKFRKTIKLIYFYFNN